VDDEFNPQEKVMNFSNFRAPLVLTTLAILASPLAQADTPSRAPMPGNTKYTPVKLTRSAEDEKKAANYERLARQNKPRTAEQEKLVKEYMKLPPSQRPAFKAAHPDVQKSIWDLAPYAVCFYASVAGGADVVDAGDECHADWVK
jgi:hypothetical protein